MPFDHYYDYWDCCDVSVERIALCVGKPPLPVEPTGQPLAGPGLAGLTLNSTKELIPPIVDIDGFTSEGKNIIKK